MTGSANDEPAIWDARYSASERVWSGEPNGALVTEVEGLTPGRALDVGCGEGADAVWLARRGWEVTAIDVSQVALDRAQSHARDAGANITWQRAGLLDASLDPRRYDLVSVQYPALRATPEREAERALLDAVAPGGTLLVVHHADADLPEARARARASGFDPADYVFPRDVAEVLDEHWVVEVDDRRPRHVSGGAGAHHHDDLVLRARRRG